MDIRIPHLGEGADSGSVVSVFVKVGDKVAKDQTLIELENEKAVAPIPSTHAGVVKKIYVNVGDKVTVGQAIVALDESGAPVSAVPSAVSSGPSAPAAPASSPAPAAPRLASDYTYESKSGFPPPASPTVRKIAADLGIDLGRVRGSESGGRITLADLKAYVQNLQAMAARGSAGPAQAGDVPAAPRPAAEKIDFSKWGPVTRQPMSSLRQKIGRKMSESWTSVPHVTQFDEADITALMALRKKVAPAYEKKGGLLTITPFLMKAAAAALKKYPTFNASLDEAAGELILKSYFHIGIAVDTEAGLIVPVIRDVDKKSLLDLAKELGAAAEKTRQRKVSIDDLKGGSFTISNLGSIGGTFFTPIVNVPEVAILGVGRGALKPVVTAAKTVEPRLMLPLGLSYDHRAVDGADGARFVREVVQTLENFPEKDVLI